MKKDNQLEQTVRELISQMTLEEKIDYIGGYQEFYIRGINRLGIPQVVMADGPLGCRSNGKGTAYPAPIGLAASWNRQLANQFGTAIGRDGRAKGVHIMLMPGINIYRSPLCGRNFEYMGEDPFLAGRMASSIVEGVQSQGVMATVKHYACNNQEYDRHNISSDIDQRTLHEIYLPAFKYVVQNAKVGAVMTGYNLVNGIHCSEHDYLINKILKSLWGFDGFVMSDWVSTYDGVAAANGGLDLEMPCAEYMNRENLIPAIKAGKVSVATIDDKILRILKSLMKMGFFNRPQKDDTIPLDDPASAKTALQMAREGIVLLKNTGSILPLNADKIKNIAVLGPNASMKYKASGGGGSSYVNTFIAIGAADAIKTLSNGKFEVLTANDKTEDVARYNFEDFKIISGGFNCKIYEFNDKYRERESADIKPIAIKKSKKIDFSSAENNLKVGKTFMVACNGTIKPKKTGIYRFSTQAEGIELRYVSLDDEKILRHKRTECNDVDLYLEKNKIYNLKLYFNNRDGNEDYVLKLGGKFVTDFEDYANIEAMRKADAVVMCVGFNPNTEAEEGDRSYRLPVLQEMMIMKAAEVNKNTIVVLTAGGSVSTQGWIDKVNGFIHNWYPGQNGAIALAEIIFGQINPSGKLPITFERRLEDLPTYNSYHTNNGDKRVSYSEGIFVGYRAFEKSNISPLFCFGHGLSYTNYEYSNMKIVPVANGFEVSLNIKNAGKFKGAEVVQLYISDVKCSIERPVKELKGFEKILLEPNEKRGVQFFIGFDELSFYSVDSKQWIAEPGEFKILVGSSSEDIRLTGTIVLAKASAVTSRQNLKEVLMT